MKRKISSILLFIYAFIQVHAQIIIPQAIHPYLSSGKTYYISSSGGKDSNTGLSPSQAWKTPAKITYYDSQDILLANTKILFKRGDVWNDTGFILKNLHGTNSNPITIGAYGIGNKPIISGKSVINAEFQKLKDNSENQIQNLWICSMDADPGRIFDSNNNELMKGYDVRFHETFVYNAMQTGSIKSYNQNQYDLGQYPYSLLNECTSPITQGNNQQERNRWMWISEPIFFEYNVPPNTPGGANTKRTISIPGNRFIFYSETDPNNLTLYKSTNSGENWRSNTNIQILESSNILITDINFQGGNDCVGIGNYGETVPNDIAAISKNIEIKNCDIGKYSYKAIEIRNAENIKIHDNIFDSGYNKKLGLSQTNCKAVIFNLNDASGDSNLGYYYTGSDRGNGDAIQLAYYAKDCEIYNNQFKNFSHAAVQLNTWRYQEPHIADSRWSVSGNKIYNNNISSPDLSYGRAFTVFGNKSENNEFYNNLVKNVTIQSQVAGINNSFHHNIFENITQSDMRPKGYAVGIRVVPTQPDILCKENKFDNNTFINCEDAGIMITSLKGYQYVEENSFRNNLIYNSGSEGWGGLIVQSKIPNLSSDSVRYNHYLNNLVYNTNSAIPHVIYHNAVHSTSSFNSQDGDDHGNAIKNNISQNPGFVNVATSYNLVNNSICRNGGDISVILDNNGNLLNNNQFNKFDYYGAVFPNEKPDIGAVEVNPVVTKISNTDEECNKELPLTNTRVDFYPIPNNTQGYTVKITDSNLKYLEFYTTSTHFYLSDYYNTELRNNLGVLTGEFIRPNTWYDIKIKKGNFNNLYNYSNYGGHCNVRSPNFQTNKNIVDNLSKTPNNESIPLFYPNPVHDVLNVVNNGKTMKIRIFNINNVEVINSEVSGNNNKINLSNLSNGVYSIVISKDRELIYGQLIKK